MYKKLNKLLLGVEIPQLRLQGALSLARTKGPRRKMRGVKATLKRPMTGNGGRERDPTF